MDPALARAALEWMLELGADEAIGDAPVDRTAPVAAPERVAAERTVPARPAPEPARAPAPEPAHAPVRAPASPAAPALDPASLPDLAALAAAMEALPEPLKASARRFVFADGTPGAPLMVVGEAPGREEDEQGRPFVGPAGRLLDRMLAAIGRDRTAAEPARAVYIANVLPWRPTGNRTPTDAEVARWRPFLLRHVGLARPRVLVLAGNTPARALLGRGGITMLRGQWQEVAGLPAMPTFHPSFVLRLEGGPPAELADAKRKVWADLQAVRDRLGA